MIVPALLVVSGLLGALAFSTHATGWLAWVAFVPLFLVFFKHQPTPAQGARWGFIFGMAFYIGVIHWLRELHPLTWLPGVTNEVSLLIVYGGIFGISLVCALFTTGFGALLAWLKPTGWRQMAYPALLWILMEWVQGLGEVSLPWARLAISQYHNLPLLQIAHITGHVFVDGLIIAWNAALARFILEYVPTPPKRLTQYRTLAPLGGVLLLVMGVWGYGWQRLQKSPAVTPETPGIITAAVIQGNIPQGEKWDREKFWERMQEIRDNYLQLSAEAIQTGQPQLIVWPESALPVYMRFTPEYRQLLGSFAQRTNTWLLTGNFDTLGEGKPVYNAALLFEPSGKHDQWYYKRQRVPFGEFFPYRDVLGNIPVLGSLINSINPMQSDTAAGTDPGLMKTPFGQIGTLICFESVYPAVARSSVQAGAEVLAIITNDGWYKDAIAVYQHNAHAVLRAIENDRDIIRSANTGVSSFIDHRGRILSQTVPLVRTFQVHPVQARKTMTPYTRWGEWFVLVSALLLAAAVAAERIGSKKAAATE